MPRFHIDTKYITAVYGSFMLAINLVGRKQHHHLVRTDTSQDTAVTRFSIRTIAVVSADRKSMRSQEHVYLEFIVLHH